MALAPSWCGDWRPWRFRIGGTRLTGGLRVIDDVANGDTVSLHADVDDANRAAELLNWGGAAAITDGSCASGETLNRLYYGDNLDVLRRHVDDESVDLVYLDPPFNSNDPGGHGSEIAEHH